MREAGGRTMLKSKTYMKEPTRESGLKFNILGHLNKLLKEAKTKSRTQLANTFRLLFS